MLYDREKEVKGYIWELLLKCIDQSAYDITKKNRVTKDRRIIGICWINKTWC